MHRILGLAIVATSIAAPQSTSASSDTKLFVKYRVKSTCTVYPNYPKAGVKGQQLAWTVPVDDNLVWRYNVNSTWAVVQDPSRANSHFPWWGFTRRTCLGKSVEQQDYPTGVGVPTKIRQGRSHVASDGWRHVDYDQGPETIVDHDVRVKKNGTLRDRANFVVGNVFAGWKVDVTSLTRTGGHWVYVYSPSARKWGYVEAEKLDR